MNRKMEIEPSPILLNQPILGAEPADRLASGAECSFMAIFDEKMSDSADD
jgi:hypothetical protein